MAIGESHKGTMSKGQKREFVSGLRTMNERDADLQYVLGKRDMPLASRCTPFSSHRMVPVAVLMGFNACRSTRTPTRLT